MASIPGSHYDVYAGGQTINFGVTSTPGNPPPPVPGDFNIEVIVPPSNANVNTPAGYQGVVRLSNGGATLVLGHGNFQVTDNGGNDSIVAGDGNFTIIGAAGDTIKGGTGAQRIDGSAGNPSIIGGSGGTETTIGGPGAPLPGGSGTAASGRGPRTGRAT